MKVRLKNNGGYSGLLTEVGSIVDAYKDGEGYKCLVVYQDYNNSIKEDYLYFFGLEVEIIEEDTKDQHYNNTNGSLYKFAVDHGLNAYEFDIVKRVVRCRKKGQFVEDLEKTKRVIDLYLKENGSAHG